MRLFLLLMAGLVLAQPQPPAFEVVSVKSANPQPGRGGMGTGMYTYPGGRVLATNCPLSYVIEQAFDTKILFPNAPSWVSDERFDIDARPPANSKSAQSNPNNFKLPPNDEQRQMLQTLLAERFQLKFHRETKEDNVYLLVAGKSPKLQAAKDPNAYPWAGNFSDGGMAGYAGIDITMTQLAKRLSGETGRPVLDRTGLTGSFDFKYTYAADDTRPDRLSTLIASIDGLGLKLQAAKAPVEAVVIDHVEKPTPN